jgi:hypothetical protein
MTGKQLRFKGMNLAAAKRQADLEVARTTLYMLARSRPDREVTAEDVAHMELGNAAGSLFRGRDWVWTGRFTESKVPKRHSGLIRVWRLKQVYE